LRDVPCTCMCTMDRSPAHCHYQPSLLCPLPTPHSSQQQQCAHLANRLVANQLLAALMWRSKKAFFFFTYIACVGVHFLELSKLKIPSRFVGSGTHLWRSTRRLETTRNTEAKRGAWFCLPRSHQFGMRRKKASRHVDSDKHRGASSFGTLSKL
jgi:hypothetical protein